MRPIPFVIAAVAMVAGCAPDFDAELERWRETRIANLTREESWTSLVGLYWLDPAASTTIGAGTDNTLAIAGLPDTFGAIRHDGGRWLLTLAPSASASIDAVPVDGEVILLDTHGDDAKAPVKVVAGRIRFVTIERGGRVGLRVWDAQAPTRTGFAGIESFPADASWRIDARWQPHDGARTIDIATVIGTVEPMANPGVAVFERDGTTHRLEALREDGSDELFFILADRTSGRSTYGAGRYFYASLPEGDRVALDFNRAYNPPCAFTEFATCPLPPPENRLDLVVNAGEQTYARPGGH